MKANSVPQACTLCLAVKINVDEATSKKFFIFRIFIVRQPKGLNPRSNKQNEFEKFRKTNSVPQACTLCLAVKINVDKATSEKFFIFRTFIPGFRHYLFITLASILASKLAGETRRT